MNLADVISNYNKKHYFKFYYLNKIQYKVGKNAPAEKKEGLKMTKQEFINLASSKVNLKKIEVEEVFNLLIDSIK